MYCFFSFKLRDYSFVYSFFAFFVFKTKKQAAILAAGFKGEKEVLKLLSTLPKGYFVIPDATLFIGHKTAQIDYIVIGKSGVFVIETKNLNGIISGSIDSKTLLKTKTIKSGDTYNKQIYNPVLQLSTHMKLISELFCSNNIGLEIFGCVYFSHPKAINNIKGKRQNISIFTSSQSGAKLLVSQILRCKEYELNKKQIQKIKSLVFSHCK